MNEKKVELIKLSAGFKDEFLKMAADYLSAEEERYKTESENFDAYLARLEMYRTGKNHRKTRWTTRKSNGLRTDRKTYFAILD